MLIKKFKGVFKLLKFGSISFLMSFQSNISLTITGSIS